MGLAASVRAAGDSRHGGPSSERIPGAWATDLFAVQSALPVLLLESVGFTEAAYRPAQSISASGGQWRERTRELSPLCRLFGVDFICVDPWSGTRFCTHPARRAPSEPLTLSGSNGASRKSAATWGWVPKFPFGTSSFLLTMPRGVHDRKLSVFVLAYGEWPAMGLEFVYYCGLRCSTSCAMQTCIKMQVCHNPSPPDPMPAVACGGALPPRPRPAPLLSSLWWALHPP